MKNDTSSQQLARLHTKLVVPFAVGEMLHDGQELTPDMHYALHEALSEMDPDTALLAIALSAAHVAAQLCPQVPVSCALNAEAAKIVEEYGADWLSHADGQAPSREGRDLLSLLEHIPEDLEALADILDASRAELEESDPVNQIGFILSAQARAHKDIAEYVLAELEGQDIQTAPYDRAAATGQNIIVFPGYSLH